MQPTLCSRCHKNVAVIFISKLEGGETKNEGLCLKCARELGIKPIDDMMKKMGISDEDLDNLSIAHDRIRFGIRELFQLDSRGWPSRTAGTMSRMTAVPPPSPS